MCSDLDLMWLRSVYRDDSRAVRDVIVTNVRNLNARRPSPAVEETLAALHAPDLPDYLGGWAAAQEAEEEEPDAVRDAALGHYRELQQALFQKLDGFSRL